MSAGNLFVCTVAAVVSAGCRSYPLPSTPDVNASAQVEHGLALDRIRLKREVCAGVPLDPEIGQLGVESAITYLKAQGFDAHTSAARTDLEYIDVPLPNKRTVRLRVAVLPTSIRAGEELHEAMTLQGTGSWGVHRGNLAILGPVGHVDDVVAFATKTRLACWGVLTLQDGDDAIAIPGGYLEF